jgi:cyanate permease
MIFLHTVQSREGARVFYWIYGLACGGTFAFENVLLADAFGRRSLGKISALATGCWTLCSGAGPLVFGFGKDRTGSYEGVVIGLAVLNGAGALWKLVTVQPVPMTGGAGMSMKGVHMV